MNAMQYQEKVNEVLSDATTYRRLPHNLLEKQKRAFKNALKTISAQLPDSHQFYMKFVPKNPNLSYFYGFPKIHKPNTPLLPIISSVGTIICRPLSDWLAGHLSA